MSVSEPPPTLGGDDKCFGGANAGLNCAQHSDCPAGACQVKNRFITATIPGTASSHGIKVTLVNIDANSVATPANYTDLGPCPSWVGPADWV